MCLASVVEAESHPGWEQIPVEGREAFTGLSLGEHGVVWVAGEAMLRRWSGSRWDLAARRPDNLPAAEDGIEAPGWLHQIYAVGDAVYASAGPDLVLKYQGGAWSWVGKIPRSISNEPSLDGAGPDALFAGSDYYSGFVRWDSRGASSFTDAGDGSLRAVDIQVVTPQRVLVLGFDCVVREYRPLDDSLRLLFSMDEARSMRAVWSDPAGNGVVAVGSDGAIWAWRNQGAPEKMAAPGTQDLNDVWGTSLQDVFAVGNDGAIWHFDGTRWSAMESPTKSTLFAVRGDGDSVWAAGAEGTLLRLPRR